MSEQFVVGIHAVSALLNQGLRKTRRLYVNEEREDSRLQALLQLAKQHDIMVEPWSIQAMNEQFPEGSHQGVVAVADPLPEYGERDLDLLLSMSKQPGLILILDGVTDPHNLGACLRSADAAGVDFVIIPKDKNASVTAVVSKVACGAAESVPLLRVTNLARVIRYLKEQGIWIYGAAGEAVASIYDLDTTQPIALVLGSEDKGLRHLTRQHCDGLFALPMRGTVSSLNVSVAAGVCLYEVVRQRGSQDE